MDYFAGLDVSVKETSVCIVDDTGRMVREVKVASEPEALLPVLTNELDQSLVPCRHEAGGDCPYPSCVTVCREQGSRYGGEGEAVEVRLDG